MTADRAAQGYTEVTRLLLRYGADVNQTDGFGFTALVNAAIFNHPDVVSVLIDHRANVLMAASCGLTAQCAAEDNLSWGADAQRHNKAEYQHKANAIVAMLKAEELNRAKCIAFAMGRQNRLGAQSLVRTLHTELVQIVLERV
jgi:ankyrin repeat protein